MSDCNCVSAKQMASRMAMLSLKIGKRWERGTDHLRGFEELMAGKCTPPRVGEPASQECVDFIRAAIAFMCQLEHSLYDSKRDWVENLIPELENLAILVDDLAACSCCDQ